MKVLLDPRQETVYPGAIQRQYVQVLARRGDRIRIIEDSGSDYVLWPTVERGGRAPHHALPEKGRWRQVFEDRRSVLLERVDGRSAPTVRTTGASSVQSWALADRATRAGDLIEAERRLIEATQQRPILVDVCRDLAILHATKGDGRAMRSTGNRCDRIFPDPPEWRDRLEKYRASRRTGGG